MTAIVFCINPVPRSLFALAVIALLGSNTVIATPLRQPLPPSGVTITADSPSQARDISPPVNPTHPPKDSEKNVDHHKPNHGPHYHNSTTSPHHDKPDHNERQPDHSKSHHGHHNSTETPKHGKPDKEKPNDEKSEHGKPDNDKDDIHARRVKEDTDGGRDDGKEDKKNDGKEDKNDDEGHHTGHKPHTNHTPKAKQPQPTQPTAAA